jgi:hypothetical protein
MDLSQMLTPEERFWIGIEVLERVRPRLKTRRQASHARTSPPDWEYSASEVEGEQAPGTASPIYDRGRGNQSLPCGLQSVLEETGSFSPQTVILGVCSDQLPFTLDLNDPAPGALLIVGDQGSGKTGLLRSILTSAVCINRPGELTFQVIASNPEEYEDLAQQAHCSQVLSPADPQARSLVFNLANIVEQRRRGNLRGPAILLVVDDLAEWALFMDAEEYASLLTILKHGPRLRIWTIAALPTGSAGEVSERLVAAFRTRILGYTTDIETAEYLAGDSASQADELTPGIEFTTPFGAEWIRFSVLSDQ